MRLFKLLLIVVLGLAVFESSSAAETKLKQPDHYLLFLESPFEAAEWPIHAHFELEGSRFGRTWVTGVWQLMWAKGPRLALDPASLRIRDDAVMGPLKIALHNSPNEVEATLTFDIDVRRDGDQLRGTWTQQFGKPGGTRDVEGAASGPASDDQGRMTLKLADILPDREPGSSYVWLVLPREGNKLADGFIQAHRTYNKQIHPLDHDSNTLEFDGKRIHGEFHVTLLPDGHVPVNRQPVRVQVSLDAELKADGNLVGRYQGKWGLPLTWSGSVGGQAVSHDTWLAQNRLSDEGPGWPQYTGPFSNGAGARYGHELVKSLGDARLQWQSDTMPRGRGSSATRSAAYADGGASSPVVKDGRVFVFYELPAGGVYDKGAEEAAKGHSQHDKSQWSIGSDEVIHAVDATTGHTLWKRVFKDAGLFWLTGKHSVPNLTPVVLRDRVCAIGTTGSVYCVEAKTGKPVWQSDIGPLAEALREHKKKCLDAERHLNGPRMKRCSGLACSQSENALITTDFRGRDLDQGLMAFDGDSGKVLWTHEQVISYWSAPIVWQHRGHEYVIVADTHGHVRCIHPRSGDVLWKESGVGKCIAEPAVIGDVLIAPVGGLDWEGGYAFSNYYRTARPRIGGFRISSRGMKRLWQLPDEYAYPDASVPTGRDGYMYLRLENAHHVVDLEKGKIIATEKTDPYQSSPGSSHSNRTGISEMWEDRWVYCWNYTHDRSDPRHSVVRELHLSMFDAEPKRFRLIDFHLLPHKRFVSYDMRGLSWPYVDGRIFLRGGDGVVCYDLRKRARQ